MSIADKFILYLSRCDLALQMGVGEFSCRDEVGNDACNREKGASKATLHNI